jgi:holin-like protein
MIFPLTLLLGFQLAGEVLSRGLGLPFPGPVLGLAGLLVALRLVPGLAGRMQAVAQGLLANLSLLFVPAGVGVVGHLEVLRAEGVGLILALVGSTALAIAVGALVFQAVVRWQERRA